MDDIHLNYCIEGNGPTLLVVHGFGISFNIWKDLVPFLRPYFKLILIELPGIGESPMPTLDADYLDTSVEAIERVRIQLKCERWNVLGYSTGSRIAEAYVQSYAAAIQQAIFLCPLKIDWVKTCSLRLAFWIEKYIPTMVNWVLRGARLRFLISFFGFNLRSDPHVSEWYREISSQPPRVLKETVKLVIRLGGKDFSVPVPYSLIWGDTDIVPDKPRRNEKRDHFVHGNHAAPVVAAKEVAETIIQILQP